MTIIRKSNFIIAYAILCMTGTFATQTSLDVDKQSYDQADICCLHKSCPIYRCPEEIRRLICQNMSNCDLLGCITTITPLTYSAQEELIYRMKHQGYLQVIIEKKRHMDILKMIKKEVLRKIHVHIESDALRAFSSRQLKIPGNIGNVTFSKQDDDGIAAPPKVITAMYR